uniref:Uncharacterized protein n=1 Tax=Ditylenchus dipsaci TaxID=166011 RepID=A0A915D8H8_9BILA
MHYAAIKSELVGSKGQKVISAKAMQIQTGRWSKDCNVAETGLGGDKRAEQASLPITTIEKEDSEESAEEGGLKPSLTLFDGVMVMLGALLALESSYHLKECMKTLFLLVFLWLFGSFAVDSLPSELIAMRSSAHSSVNLECVIVRPSVLPLLQPAIPCSSVVSCCVIILLCLINLFTITKLAALALIIGTGLILIAIGDPYRDSFEDMFDVPQLELEVLRLHSTLDFGPTTAGII